MMSARLLGFCLRQYRAFREYEIGSNYLLKGSSGAHLLKHLSTKKDNVDLIKNISEIEKQEERVNERNTDV